MRLLLFPTHFVMTYAFRQSLGDMIEYVKPLGLPHAGSREERPESWTGFAQVICLRLISRKPGELDHEIEPERRCHRSSRIRSIRSWVASS